MTVLQGVDGYLLGVGGDQQPFPRSSMPLGSFGDAVTLVGGRTVSYTDLYRRQIWVAVAVHKLSRQVSRLPLKAYKQTAKGRERISTGTLAQLLRSPWPRAGSTQLKQAIMISALVQGNAALRKVRDRRGLVTSLEPLVWSWLRVIRSFGGEIEGWQTQQPNQPTVMGPDDVLHVAWRGVEGPIGISPLYQLGTTIAVEDAAQRYQKSLLANSAIPESKVTVDKEFLGLDKAKQATIMQNLRDDLVTLHAGADNAGRPALLPPGVNWEPVGHTAVEAELIDQRKITREEIAAVYDVSPPLIGILERSTFNNITELHRMLYVTVLGPWLTLIEETLQAQLIDPEPGVRGDIWVEFDLSEVLKGDLLQRAQALALQISFGVLTIDEARDIENRVTFDLPATRVPLYPANNLKPATVIEQDTGGGGGASSEDVQQAALALAGMGEHDVRSLLARSGGSVIDAIFELAGTSRNGSHPEPAAPPA